jgi:hypothetical protein
VCLGRKMGLKDQAAYQREALDDLLQKYAAAK